MCAIIFQDKEYLIRDIKLREFGEVTISTTSLDEAMMTKENEYVSAEAQRVDERIFFFVDEDEIKLPNRKLKKIIYEAIF